MKKIWSTASGVIISLMFIMVAVISAQTGNSANLPTLRGDEAIEKLKETGQYDSLRDAFNASRKKNEQTGEPNVEDAIGQTRKLLASDAAISDNFGISVAISGDTAIVGAYQEDTAPNSNDGAAYVFVRSGTMWTEQAKLLASDAATGDNFGYSVAISGDTAVVGAYVEDTAPNTNNGAAYIFVRSGTMWTQSAKLTDTNSPATDDEFGTSVGISGDKIIVGAPNSDDAASTPLTEGSLVPQAADQGAVFMFVNNFIPTAAGVSIGGRILTQNGAGIRNAVVNLTLTNGETRTVRTGTFGYYRFDDLEAGETYIISVASKRFTFTPRIVTANDNLTEVDFTAIE